MRRKLIVALLISAAFNLGFVAQAAVEFVRGAGRPASADLSCYPNDFQTLCSGLQERLPTLRVERAEATRELAQLLAADEPDEARISACLDRLSAVERRIKGEVIDTVLAQRETLDAEARRGFCDLVHQRLCDPWADCRATSKCAPHGASDQPTCSHHDTNANGRHQ